MAKSSFLSWAIWREGAVHLVAQRCEGHLADVERDRAGLDLRQVEDVVDQAEQVRRRRRGWSWRTRPACRSGCPPRCRLSSFDRISRLLSGVRSSWDMFARNSDLYLEVSASCSAFSSSACLACSTSRFLASTCLFCVESSSAFSSSSSLVCCSSSCLAAQQLFRLPQRRGLLLQPVVGLLQLFLLRLQLAVSNCDCFSSSSVRMLAAIVLSTMPMDSISWSRNDWWISLNSLEGGQLDHRLHLAFEQHRQDDDVERRGLAQARADLDVVLGHVGEQDALLLEGALADQAFAELERVGQVLAAVEGVGRRRGSAPCRRPRPVRRRRRRRAGR